MKALSGVALVSLHHLKLLLDALLFSIGAVLWDAWEGILSLAHLDHLELIWVP